MTSPTKTMKSLGHQDSKVPTETVDVSNDAVRMQQPRRTLRPSNESTVDTVHGKNKEYIMGNRQSALLESQILNTSGTELQRLHVESKEDSDSQYPQLPQDARHVNTTSEIKEDSRRNYSVLHHSRIIPCSPDMKADLLPQRVSQTHYDNDYLERKPQVMSKLTHTGQYHECSQQREPSDNNLHTSPSSLQLSYYRASESRGGNAEEILYIPKISDTRNGTVKHSTTVQTLDSVQSSNATQNHQGAVQVENSYENRELMQSALQLKHYPKPEVAGLPNPNRPSRLESENSTDVTASLTQYGNRRSTQHTNFKVTMLIQGQCNTIKRH